MTIFLKRVEHCLECDQPVKTEFFETHDGRNKQDHMVHRNTSNHRCEECRRRDRKLLGHHKHHHREASDDEETEIETERDEDGSNSYVSASNLEYDGVEEYQR